MRRIYCLFALVLLCFISACNVNNSFEQPTATPQSMEDIEKEQQKQRFNDFAAKYNAIDYDIYKKDIGNLEFASEIIREYNGVNIAEYDFCFDDIFINENNYIGTSWFNYNSYYSIPDTLYDKIVQNEGRCCGIIYKLNNISFTERGLDAEGEFHSHVDKGGYIEADIELRSNSYIDRNYYYDVIDIYIDEQ